MDGEGSARPGAAPPTWPPTSSPARQLPSRGVALHAAGVGGGAEQPGGRVAADRGQPAERPRLGDDHQVAAAAQALERGGAEPLLNHDLAGTVLPGPERARERGGVEGGRVDGGLEVEAEVDVVEEQPERPLVLLVAAWGAEGEHRLPVAEDERRRQRG